MAGGRLHAQRLQHADHVAAPGRERRERALQGVAAVEQQHALRAALGADGVDERRHAVHAADAAVGPGQRLVVVRAQHVGVGRGLGNREGVEQLRAGDVGKLAAGVADAEVERRLAVVEGLQLRVRVRHVQDGELALGREPQQVLLPDRLLRGRAAQASAGAKTGDGGRGGSDLQEVSARDHASSILAHTAPTPAAALAAWATPANLQAYLLTGLSGDITNATRSLICSTLRNLLAPRRGMFAQGMAACGL